MEFYNVLIIAHLNQNKDGHLSISHSRRPRRRYQVRTITTSVLLTLLAYSRRFGSSEDPGEEKPDTPWPVLPAQFTEKYEMMSRIGKGAFGYVYKVRERQTRAIYAAKQLPNTDNNKMEVSNKRRSMNCCYATSATS